MIKPKSRKDIYILICYILAIILLIISSCLPFVIANDRQVFLVHFFNPTSHAYNGRIESAYGIILPILVFASLLIDFINFKTHEYKKNAFNTCFKITLLATFIFTIMNYFRVIYPDGFIVSGDVSILQTGFYLFVFFLILLFAIIVLKVDELYHIQKDNNKDLVVNHDKRRKQYYIVIRVFSFISMFCVISLLFVPYARNYQNYMFEEGFETILDKRTSIDYYIFAMFDKDFNLNILGFLLIYLACFIPTTLLLPPRKTTFMQILICSIFEIILYVIALLIASENYLLIPPKLSLQIDWISLVFLSINFLSLFMLVIFTSLLINYRRKELKDVARNVSEL